MAVGSLVGGPEEIVGLGAAKVIGTAAVKVAGSITAKELSLTPTKSTLAR
jgi:hypothetical protein